MPISDPGNYKAGPGRQRGSAIIGALLIVVVVTAIAASLMVRQSAFLRTVQTDQTQLQARWLARAGLDRAISTLRQEGTRRQAVHWDGEWAKPLRATRFGDEARSQFGEFSGQIEDAQAKFNLRNLVREGVLDPMEVDAFSRLCAMVDVKADVCQRIVRHVLIAQPNAGEDDETGSEAPGSAESGQSAQMETAQRKPVRLAVPRVPMPRTVEDLLAIPGVDAQVVAKLAPLVTILPAPTWINANTSGPEVLAAWVPGLSIEQARALLDGRDRGQWFVNRGDFANRLQRRDLAESSIRIGITSEWFIASGVVRTGTAVIVTRALIRRDYHSNEVRVAWMEGA